MTFDDFEISGEPLVLELDQVQAEIAGSAEYFSSQGQGRFEGFVEALYEDLLGREPTEAERDDATSRLLDGADRSGLAHELAFSQEGAIRRVDSLYELLRRPGELVELVDYGQLLQTDDGDAVANSLIASEEYFTRYGTQTWAQDRSQGEIDEQLILDWLTSPPEPGNAERTDGFESVGVLGDKVSGRGGGTFIAPRYVVTAAHLVAERDVSDLRFTIDGEVYGVSKVAIHPAYDRLLLSTDDGNDIAVLQLNREVIGVEPSPLFRGTPEIGEELTLVGFGPRADNDQFGIKHAGTTPLDGITPRLLTWNYDGAHESTTVDGDSGSPEFVQRGDEYYLAAVTSGGTLRNSNVGDFAYNTRIDVYVDWIAAVIGDGETQP